MHLHHKLLSALFFLAAFGLFLIPAQSAHAAADHIIITEVQYDPDVIENLAEWVELFNPTPDPVDIGGWTLKEFAGFWYTFPASTIIPSGGYLLVVNDTVAFNNPANHPTITPDIDMDGPNCFGATQCIRLNNVGGDQLTLEDDQPGLGTVIDFVGWEGVPPTWNGVGNDNFSICRATSDDTDTPADWVDDCTPDPGTGSYAFDSNPATTSSDDDDDDRDIKRPRNVTVLCSARDGNALLTWKDRSEGERGNKIQRQTNSGPWETVKKSRTKNRENWTDSGLARGNTYAWRIRAYHKDDHSKWAGFVSCQM